MPRAGWLLLMVVLAVFGTPADPLATGQADAEWPRTPADRFWWAQTMLGEEGDRADKLARYEEVTRLHPDSWEGMAALTLRMRSCAAREEEQETADRLAETLLERYAPFSPGWTLHALRHLLGRSEDPEAALRAWNDRLARRGASVVEGYRAVEESDRRVAAFPDGSPHLWNVDWNDDGADEILVHADGFLSGWRAVEGIEGEWIESFRIPAPFSPSGIAAGDADGDGRRELLVAIPGSLARIGSEEEGILATGHLLLLERGDSGWTLDHLIELPETARPRADPIGIRDVDADGAAEILWTDTERKVRVARWRDGAWQVGTLDWIGEGWSHVFVDPVDALEVAGGEPAVFSARGYESLLFSVSGSQVELPGTRGCTACVVGDPDRDGAIEIAVGDGYHPDYGKIARGRVALLERDGKGWRYELIEETRWQNRIEELALADLDGDGADELLAQGSVYLTIYRKGEDGWKRLRIPEAQAFRTVASAGVGPEMLLAWDGLRWSRIPPERLAGWTETDPFEGPNELSEAEESLVGRPAPGFGDGVVLQGDLPDPSAPGGAVILLHFISGGNGWRNQRLNVETYAAWHEEFGDRGLRVVQVFREIAPTGRERLETLVAHRPFPDAVFWDRDRWTLVRYGVRGVPRTFLIGRDGVVRWTAVTGTAEGIEAGREVLERIIDESVPGR